ncbi:MAG: hypothetical protein IPJ88_07325 [Myxococcales bacterium]|nr:MAG: hypothetical protein IPJ88_07325 [Myxococcales bacterium]
MEHSTWNKQNFQLQFENIPTSNTVKKYLINRGTISLNDLGNGKTERIAEGELKLNLPFLLKPLAPIGERLIHGEAEKILNGEAEVLKKKLGSV